MHFLILGGFLLEGMRSDAELECTKTFAALDCMEVDVTNGFDTECDVVLEEVESDRGCKLPNGTESGRVTDEIADPDCFDDTFDCWGGWGKGISDGLGVKLGRVPHELRAAARFAFCILVVCRTCCDFDVKSVFTNKIIVETDLTEGKYDLEGLLPRPLFHYRTSDGYTITLASHQCPGHQTEADGNAVRRFSWSTGCRARVGRGITDIYWGRSRV
jgi:hypothetical protein